MQIFWQDVRHAMRMLMKNRVFTAVAIITLALGIGANAAIFSVLDAVLLKPLPYDDPDRLLVLSERRPDAQRNTVSVANFLDWQRENKVFTQVSATFSNSFNLSGTEQSEKISGMFVTANHFDVLGVKPAFGRTFQPDEDQAGHSRVVVISHRLWQQLFAPDRNLLEKELILDGDRYAVIGVLKPDTNFDRAVAQLYVPLTFDANRSDRRSHFLRVYARLKHDVTLPQAQTEMDAIAATIAHQSPDTNRGWGITLDKLSDRVGSPQLRQTVSVLFGAVVFVLLIACANLANLLLARTTDRYKEISIRAALGAARGRLVRQFLTESIVLSQLGGIAGLALAIWLVQLFSSLMPPLTLPPEAQLALDYRVVLFTFGAALLTGLFIGLIPAWQASKHDLSEALKEGGKNSTAASSGRYVSNLLIISEVSLALVLLIGSVLLMRNMLHLRETRLGFETANTLTMHVSLPATKYKTPAQMEAFYSQALHRIATLPGVVFASTVSDIPLRGWTFGEAFEVEGQPASSEPKINGAHYQRISPDYFKTLSIPLLEGRHFTSQDQPTNTPVIIINET